MEMAKISKLSDGIREFINGPSTCHDTVFYFYKKASILDDICKVLFNKRWYTIIGDYHRRNKV